MASNIEIKAQANDFTGQRERAEAMSDVPGEAFLQEDVFFNVTKGRLKLRILGDHSGTLIFYQRDDSSGPRWSHYLVSKTHEPEALKNVLSSSLGVRGVVRKHRTVYKVGRTRIHFDRVEGLGDFVELECVMDSSTGEEEASHGVRNLMDILGIRESDLIGEAYIDLLLR